MSKTGQDEGANRRGEVRRSRAMGNVELVERLCDASVALREARRLHLRDYGVLIPHVFMAEVLKRMGACLSMGRAHGMELHGKEIGDVMGILELGMAEGDRETRNVIAISFARDSEMELFFDELFPFLGPRSRAQLTGR